VSVGTSKENIFYKLKKSIALTGNTQNTTPRERMTNRKIKK